ncbi:hypothetical protein TIFTF001_021264 [Ficus carica]|uniref:xyloglucan:xyloglucosyl transferase n=1 Tax=Ficus carica TaxID=3494 RepID=A0AA88DBQ5_FICCA|nr:hypothetical protein TIFTF001_021264 [Ficus carica]
MASLSSSNSVVLVFCIAVISSLIIASAGNLNQDFQITWGDGRAKISNNGELLTLSLDKASGSGFQSKNEYLFGQIDMQLKLVPGNSAGTVTAYYLSSKGSTWDEIDFEFLGNSTGEPYTLHTNVFSQGKGNREQQFHLWFDPTADFHTYSILWNPQHIVFSVDGTPIRKFKNLESKGVPYPKNQAMRIYSSLWNADDWATRGGLVKTDWSLAPFSASYRNFKANACVWSSGASSCGSNSATSNSWMSQELDSAGEKKLKWVQKNYMIYNYCTDSKRYATLAANCRCQRRQTNHRRSRLLSIVAIASPHSSSQTGLEGGAKLSSTAWGFHNQASSATASDNQRPTTTRFHGELQFAVIPPASDFTDQGRLTMRKRETGRGRRERKKRKESGDVLDKIEIDRSKYTH